MSTLQTTLFSPADIPPTEGVDLRCCPVEALLESGISGVRLVAADPPWQYEQTAVRGNAADEYACPSMPVIVDTLDRAFDCCLSDAYLLCWCTWPMIVDFVLEMQRSRWRYLSGALGIRQAGWESAFTSGATRSPSCCSQKASLARSTRRQTPSRQRGHGTARSPLNSGSACWGR